MVITEMGCRTGRGVVRVLLLVTVVGVVLAAGAGAASAAMEVDSCTTINASNAPNDGLVLLNGSIQGSSASSCVNITVSNITLDGQNNVVDGVDTTGSVGINVTNASTALTNVTVRDINVTDWGSGIEYDEADNGEITGVNATRNEDGIFLFSSSGNSITANKATGNNNDGIELDSSDGNNVTANKLTDSSRGIFLFSFSNDNDVTGNDVTGNSFGIVVQDSNDNNVTSNNVTENSGDGISVFGSNRNNVSANNVTGNDIGIEVDSGTFSTSTDNEVTANNVSANTGSGIRVVSPDSRGTVIDDNTVLDNNQGASFQAAGIFVNNGERTEITQNRVHRNTLFGVLVDNANGTVVRGNAITDNCGGTAGLAVAGASNDVLIETNNVSANTGDGIDVGFSNPFDGSNLTIRDVRANANGESGVVVQGLEGVTLRDIEANDNTNAGVGVNSQESTLGNITALRNDNIGVVVGVSGNDTVIENSEVRENGFGSLSPSTGIRVEAPDVAIRNTTTTDNDLDLSAQSGNATLELVNLGSATVSGTAKEVNINETVSPPADPSNAQNVSSFFNATNTTQDGFFDATVKYNQADADAAGVDESTLALWEFDAGSWNKLGGTVDPVADEVQFNITSFSVFAPLADTGVGTGPFPGGECVDRRNVGRGQESQECPNDRELGRGEDRRDLDRATGRNSDTSRRDRGRGSRSRGR